jgi:hypothetical protein
MRKSLSALLAAFLCMSVFTLFATAQAAAPTQAEKTEAARLFETKLSAEEERSYQHIMTISVPGGSETVVIKGDGSLAWDSLSNRFQYHLVGEAEELRIHRHMKIKALTLNGDVTVAEAVRVVVPKGATLTVPQGVTLTVYGGLRVEGTLVNNGHIVFALPEHRTVTDHTAETDEYHLTLTNIGTVKNAGTITVKRGGIANEQGGLFENSGVVSILNTQGTFAGIAMRTMMRGNSVVGTTFVNTGTVYLQNTVGTSLLVYKDSLVDNQGTIYCGEKAVIKGAIKGTKPVLKK